MTSQKEPTKILMVGPATVKAFWSFLESVKMLDKGAAMAPLALATIAAMLPEEIFKVLRVVDRNFQELTDDDLLEADLVMLTGMIIQQKSMYDTIQRAERLGKTVIVGGPFATSYSDKIFAMGSNVIVVAGEAEMTLPPFIEDWVAGHPKEMYTEESVRSRVKIELAHNGKPLMECSPIPRWDLLDLSKYCTVPVQYSRGCPHRCNFCEIPVLYGRGTRTKSVSQFIAELNTLYEAGWRGAVFIADDNLIGNANAVRELLKALIEWQEKHGYPFSLLTQASMKLADEEFRDILLMMIQAGLREVFMGIESIDPDVLRDDMGKKQNLVNLVEYIRILLAAGIEVTGGFILGNDSDKPTVFDDMYRFIQKAGIPQAMIGFLTVFRGTPLYDKMLAEGRLRDDGAGCYTHDLSLGFDPNPDLPEDVLIDGFVGLIERLYKPKNYFGRCETVDDVLGPRVHPVPLNYSRIRAALLTLYRFLIRHPNWYFAKYIFRTLIKNKGKFPDAMARAVKFADYQTITAATVKAYRFSEHAETLAEKFMRRAERVRGDAGTCVRKLNKLEGWAITRLKKMYNKLDPSFRAGAEKTLENWRNRLQSCAAEYRQKLQALSSSTQ